MPYTDAALAEINHLDELAKTRNDAWQIPRAEGEVLHHIAVSADAKLIIEVGTSYGFSTLFWASAVRRTGGHVHTIDIDPRKYEMSKQTFADAGLSGQITSHLGDAATILKTLPDSIDIAFIDAWKEQCILYFDLLWPKLRVGGSILTDNAITHREQLKEFVAHARSKTGAISTEIPVGNGVEWTIKAG
jgi:predicted O-methyltransferase YrrM